MRIVHALAFGVLLTASASTSAAADVKLSVHDGRVSIAATDATVRQILAEWARVGQIRLVNADRLPGGPLTLQLTDIAEKQALEILLRAAGGYMASARPVPSAGLSQFDRIIVMAASNAPRVAAAPAPVLQRPQAAPPQIQDNGADDRPVPEVNEPVFNAFPQPRPIGPPQVATPDVPVTELPQVIPQPGIAGDPPSSVPSSPFGGTSRPGMVVPGPTQPGAPTSKPAGQ